MTTSDKSRAILLLLVKLEEEVGSLYQLCAEQYPEHTSFWTTLAGEEARHAELLRSLLPAIESGRLAIPERNIKLDSLQFFYEYLHQQKNYVAQHHQPYHDAVSIAVDVESRIVEREYFGYFEGEAPEVEPIIAELRAESRDHLAHLEKLKEDTR